MFARHGWQIVIDPRFRRNPGAGVGVAARALARRQAEQLALVRRRAQPTAVYISRLTGTAVLAYLLALLLPGTSRPVLAPLTALLVVQATWFDTIRSAIRNAVQRVAAVTAGVLAAVGVAAYVPFSWWVLGLLIAAALALGLMLGLREAILDVPISAMLIFSVDSHAAATGRIVDTLVGAAAGLGANLVFAPLRVQPAKKAVGELSRQMAELLGQMADGLADKPGRQQAAEWLGRARALRGQMERLEDALAQAEESIRPDPSPVSGGTRPGSGHSPVTEADTQVRMAAVLGELSAAVRAYGQLIEVDRGSADPTAPGAPAPEPIAEVPEDDLEEPGRQQDRLADQLHPAEVASAVRREMDDRAAIVAKGRTLVPNDFVVELAGTGYGRLGVNAESLEVGLANPVRDYAGQKGYSFVGPVRMRFVGVPGLTTGMFRIRSSAIRDSTVGPTSRAAATDPMARSGQLPSLAEPPSPRTRVHGGGAKPRGPFG